MKKEEFLISIRPHMGVHFDQFEFQRDMDLQIRVRKFSSSEINDIYVPWYIDSRGYKTDHDKPDSYPIKFKEVNHKLDLSNSEHLERRRKIDEIKKEFKHNESYLYDPVLPVIGFNRKQRYFALDGCHRLSAALEHGIKEIHVILVESKNMADINADFKYHS